MYALFKLLLETCDRVSYLVYLALVVFVGIPDDLDHEAESVGGMWEPTGRADTPQYFIPPCSGIEMIRWKGMFSRH